MKGLSCTGLVKSFPGVRALKGVDLDVRLGEVVVLLGENGAGKSTLAKIISGIYEPDTGEMTLDGAPYRPATPADAIAAGIGTIHQESALLADLSAAENVFLGRLPLKGPLVDYGALHRAAREQLDRVGLHADPSRRVGGLSVAARQQVEIAKALSLNARLLILDEPTASLGAGETERLFTLIEDLKGHGVGFVYISHRLEEVARIGDRIVVMRDGERVRAWDTSSTPVEQLIEAMVGRSVDTVFPDLTPPSEGIVLAARGLSRGNAFENISFELRRGEILGIAGLVGAGRTELARALFGAEPVDAGTIRLNGKQLTLRGPRDAVEAGIVLVPEDRKEEGLVLTLPVADNVALPSLNELRQGPLLSTSKIRKLVDRMMRRLDIRGRISQLAATLSGGNQQKVVIAKWLARDPQVVIFDEPTRGIDVGAKASIYELIRDLARRGVGIVLISSELPEVLGMAHRVLVMSAGQQTGLLDRTEADQETVMARAVRS
jgi:ribose transport system ATP-binding protein